MQGVYPSAAPCSCGTLGKSLNYTLISSAVSQGEQNTPSEDYLRQHMESAFKVLSTK